jgi:cobalt/nickel transport protein
MRHKKGWALLLLLAVLSPIGLLAVGGAWGEWDIDTLKERIGFEPPGMKRTVETMPDAPVPDYEVPGLDGGGWGTGLSSMLSALIGAAATVAIVFVIGKAVSRGRLS